MFVWGEGEGNVIRAVVGDERVFIALVLCKGFFELLEEVNEAVPTEHRSKERSHKNVSTHKTPKIHKNPHFIPTRSYLQPCTL